jgi:PhzF family phenazine biosynthesis protein
MFVFSADDGSTIFEGGHIRARMFAPGLGIGEDPATGSACAALAGFLALRSETRDGTLRWTVDQGVEMGRPSRLELEVDLKRGQLAAIRVGGSSVLVAPAPCTSTAKASSPSPDWSCRLTYSR